MLNDELYREIRRVVCEESLKFADSITERCIELIQEYTRQNTPDFLFQEDEPPCTMPVLDSVDDIISAMPDSFQKIRQKQQDDTQNYNL